MTLELQHISKSYDGLPVLKNLNLSFQQGQCYCLMSPSGSGKTTLLRILMGLEQADHGLILADGTPQDMSSLPASAVFQEDRLCDNLDPSANIRRVAVARALLIPSHILLMDEPFTGMDDELKRNVISYIREKQDGRLLILSTHQEEDVELMGGELVRLENCMDV